MVIGMKKVQRILTLLLTVFMIFPIIPASASSPPTSIGAVPGVSSFPAVGVHDMPVIAVYNPQTTPQAAEKPERTEEFRGVWVSTVINLDYPSSTGLSAAKLKEEAISILDNCKAMGFNAVIFQVRPCGDAFYKSSIFPWSEFITGTQGKAPSDGFDPLEFWVTEAHKRGIELHAWINPYRIARNSHDLNALAASNPARKNPDWVIKHSDGHMYYNPGIPEVRQLVIDGVKEIVQNYDVDGIHLDDYFYPDNTVADSAAYKKYGGGFSKLDDWRRDNVDQVIKEISAAVKLSGKSVAFGVSPFGIWANKSSNSLGSNTNGNQSYSNHFADTRKWVKSGWVDYICPQLYWNIGFAAADYEILLKWWSDVCKGTSVDLYIGHAAYRSGNEDKNSPWYGTDELKRQLDMNSKTPEVKGSVHFRYSFFLTYPQLGTFIRSYYTAAPSPSPMTALPADYPKAQAISNTSVSVGRPDSDISTTFSEYYILGSCNPAYPLYMNGNPVEVTKNGYFGVMVSLNNGVNTFTFTQNGQTFVRKITRSSSSSGSTPTPLSKAEIVSGSTYPDVYDVYIMPGEKITFRCTAPIGAAVTVTLAGKTYNLTPATTKAPAGSGIYATQFSYTYTMPEGYAKGKIHNVGTPVYKMTYKGVSSSKTATGDLKCITEGAPYYATVTANSAFIYSSSSTTGGPIGELSRGMTDYITAVTTGGTWVRLASGYWVQRVDVDRVHGASALVSNISAPVYTVSDKADAIKFPLSAMSSAHVTYSDGAVEFRISNAANTPSFTLPAGSMISSLSVTKDGSSAVYRLTLASPNRLDGYWTEVQNGSIVLTLKRRPVASPGSSPLKGLTIMLDAGHGGSDTGAIGPLGGKMAEKDIALNITKKVKYELEALGATVLMTRTDDRLVTLADRLELSRAARPDLFLSIHCNAVEVNKNAQSIYGVSTWYRQNISANLSSQMVNQIVSDIGRYNRRSNYSNLYVCRGRWSPSLIVETGFICNPSEFEWLVDDMGQGELARSVSNSIVNYFK